MFWNESIETMDRESMRALQLKRLQWSVAHSYAHVPFYKKVLDQRGIKPEDIRTLEDIRKLPFTNKEDLREHFPYGMFAVPMSEIVRIHASSGTTGRPTVVGYTRADLDMWSEAMARLVKAAGATEDDIAQIAFGYGLFTGAFGLHYGLELIGAAVIPVSSGNTERQIQLMRDFGSTALISTPSYALYMAEVRDQMGISKDDIKLRIGLFGAEGSTEEMRTAIQERWGIIATENYGLSEILGPGVSGECTHRCGMHLNEDFFYPEILDPETDEPLPDGQWGELVLTTLQKEGLPMLRYRTHDITRLLPERCACGRTSIRMEKVRGRTDDMLIIRGVNVFPSQIESVLMSVPGIGAHYEIIVRRENYLDTLEVVVEMGDDSLLERYSELEALTNRVRSTLRAVVQLDAKVSLVSPQTLRRFEGKARRVTDLRDAQEGKA